MAARAARKKAAGTKKTVEVTTTEAPADVYSDLDPFDRVRAEFGDSVDGGKVAMTILQMPAAGGNTPEYLMKVEYDENTHGPDWIREQFGAGKFVLRFYDRESQGMWSKVFTIARLPSDKVQQEGGQEELMRMMREQNRDLMAFMLSGKAANAAPQLSLEPMVAMMNQASEQSNRMTELLLASFLNKPDTTGVLISSAEKIAEVISAFKNESSGDVLSQLPRIFKEIRPLLEAASRPAVTTPGGSAGPPGTGTAPPKPLPAPAQGFTRTGAGNTLATASVSDIQPAKNETGSLDELLKFYAPEFLKSAEAGTHPGLVANGILDSVPALYHASLQETETARIVDLHPDLTSHHEWLDEMVGYVKSGGYDDPSQTDDSGA